MMGSGVGRDSGFVGGKEGTKGGDGEVSKVGWCGWVDRKGNSGMAWKGRDEGGIVGVLWEVGLVVAKEECGETAGNVVASCKLGNGE